MVLWTGFALMTAAAILAVLWPLARKPRTARAGSDLIVYQDQLEEIDRDRSAGLIGEAEAKAARVEVSRRLIAAADAEKTAPPPAQPLWHRRTAAVAALVALSLIPVGLYAALGSPNVPGQPAFTRVATPSGDESIQTLIAQVEAHLAANPNDGPGWEVIAPVYIRLGRFDDAVVARRKALALIGETATRDSDLGEALVAAANGVVTDEAKQVFERAVAHDPHDPKARYFLGLADEQDGNRDGAADRWAALLRDAPAGAPWVGFVREALTRLTSEPIAAGGPGADGPNAQNVAAANEMTAAQRNGAIRGMVARLAGRLHADGSDVEGWLRLVNAYAVLGERDQAKQAAVDARRALADRPGDIKRIDELVKGLGLEG
jgi:cytochrome c-type biogenesis protein CcmH